MDEARGVVELELVGRQQLRVERGGRDDRITLVARDGRITFSLHITPEGPLLQFEHGLTIEAGESLELAGRRVSIRGAEGVSIESGGDATVEVAGDLTATARIQNLRARLGNVNVKANDDVRLRGERIRLNC
jgi:DNA/RNA endonuclease YhcR with UshA esterase domain